MASRAIWKGSISFGLVTIPIGLWSAIEARGELAFHLLHKKDGSRVVQKRFCKAEDVEVRWNDVVKGYEYAKDQYVVVTDEDFEKARVPATQMFEIRAFVNATEVEDLYFEHPYYVAPQGRAGVKAYALLRDAMADTGKLATGTIVLRQREQLAALEPYKDALVLTTMRFANEIRSPKELDVPASRRGWTEKEMQLTRQLVDTLSDKWNPEEFRDTYTEVLRKLIEAKAEGKKFVAPEAPKRPRVVNLMQALQRSLEERQPLATASGRRAGSRKPARAGRRRAAA
jgi:DNA end-binding protein Ku